MLACEAGPVSADKGEMAHCIGGPLLVYVRLGAPASEFGDGIADEE